MIGSRAAAMLVKSMAGELEHEMSSERIVDGAYEPRGLDVYLDDDDSLLEAVIDWRCSLKTQDAN